MSWPDLAVFCPGSTPTPSAVALSVGGLRWGGKGGSGRSRRRIDNVDSSSNNIVAALHQSIVAIVITHLTEADMPNVVA
ncbi:hypothetical protein OUZ56_006829 [Daphnia magna]|uniref:Uncharacterized protein n=1 Tax=Daphnia magna TaxID=35525 RepID=A0ABQ9YWV1_9CRUS|nr:hypothetical protein OUZ56_006829 [Daphnia magna]